MTASTCRKIGIMMLEPNVSYGRRIFPSPKEDDRRQLQQERRTPAQVLATLVILISFPDEISSLIQGGDIPYAGERLRDPLPASGSERQSRPTI